MCSSDLGRGTFRAVRVSILFPGRRGVTWMRHSGELNSTDTQQTAQTSRSETAKNDQKTQNEQSSNTAPAPKKDTNQGNTEANKPKEDEKKKNSLADTLKKQEDKNKSNNSSDPAQKSNALIARSWARCWKA